MVQGTSQAMSMSNKVLPFSNVLLLVWEIIKVF